MREFKICAVLVSILLPAFTITGCQVSNTEIVSTKIISSQTAKPTPSTAPTHPPPATLIPTSTLLIASPTTHLTPIPTLTSQERENYVRELLETNAGCELPCWWGVIPGETTWEDAKKMLQYMGVRIGTEVEPDGSTFHGMGGFDFEDEKIYNNFGFLERNSIIDSIHIWSDAGSNEAAFQSLWERYDPINIITMFGIPSRVWLSSTSIDIGNTGRTGYSLWIFYDQNGFVIRYDGGVRKAPVYHICPNFNNDFLGIRQIIFILQSPTSQLPLERIDQDGLHDKYIRTLEDATGLSLEEFYQLFAQEDQPACFDTPRDIWP